MIDALTRAEAWEKAGVTLHLVDMGGESMSTANAVGRMFLTMLAGFGQFERDLVAERTAAALQHKKARLEAYSPTPFGFDRDGDRLVVNDTEANIVRKVRRWRSRGDSL